MKDKINYTVISILIVYFFLLFRDFIFQSPNGIHEWAQADRLALAYGFFDNGMNFFKPSTFSQFSNDGITGVEFPIQAYITALIGKILGRQHLSVIFRTLDVTLVICGIVYLYFLIKEFTNNTISSIFPLCFLLLSPVFLYYTCNYLADTISAIGIMIAMTLFIQSWILKKNKSKYTAVFIFTLASLIKTSSTLYFIGFVCYDFIFIFIQKKHLIKREWKYFMTILVGFTTLIGYFLYNNYLNQIYNSDLFLFHIMLPSKETINYLFNDRLPNVMLKEYFLEYSYWFIILIIVLSYFKNSRTSLKIYLPLSFILLIGVLAVAYLMGAQFIDHDYYIIAIFFPWIYLSFFWFVLNHQTLFQNRLFNLAFVALVIFFMIGTYQKFQDRISPNYPGFSEYYRTFWMKDGKNKLNRLQIGKDEKIGVIQESAPNLTLLYFDRKGYVIKGKHWHRDFKELAIFYKKHHLKIGIGNQKEVKDLIKVQPVFYEYFQILHQDRDLIVFASK